MKLAGFARSATESILDNAGLTLLTIIVLCVPVFGLIIHYSLKNRQNTLEQWIKETNAGRVQSEMSMNERDVHSLLYGNFHDSSMTCVVLMIRDRNDQDVGTVLYETGGVTIETGGERFGVFNDGINSHKTVRPIKGQGNLEPHIAECISPGLLSKRVRYRFTNFGTVDVQFRGMGRRATLQKDGVKIGQWFRLGPYEMSGKALVLSVDVPLIVQVVLLAGPFRQRSNVTYLWLAEDLRGIRDFRVLGMECTRPFPTALS
jgi:hypothetical protein